MYSVVARARVEMLDGYGAGGKHLAHWIRSYQSSGYAKFLFLSLVKHILSIMKRLSFTWKSWSHTFEKCIFKSRATFLSEVSWQLFKRLFF